MLLVRHLVVRLDSSGHDLAPRIIIMLMISLGLSFTVLLGVIFKLPK